jgi:hypothetical protein
MTNSATDAEPDSAAEADNEADEAARNGRALIDLIGCLEWDPDFDYKSERSRQQMPQR